MADFEGSFSGSFTGSYDILTNTDQYNGTTYGYVLHQRTGVGKAENILLSDFFRDWLGSESGSAGIVDYGADGHIFDQDRILIRSGSFSGSTYRPVMKTATINNLFGGHNKGSTLRNAFIYARGVGRNVTNAQGSVSSSMLLTVNGKVLYDDYQTAAGLAGLTYTVLDSNFETVISPTRYRTDTTSGDSDALAALLTGSLSPDQIGILTSLGYWETNLTDNLRDAAFKLGLTKLGAHISTNSGSAYAAVFYGTSGSAGVGDSLERMTSYRFTRSDNDDIPVSVISTRIQSNTQNDYAFFNIAGANSTNALYAYNADTSSVLTPALFVDSEGNITASGNMIVGGGIVGGGSGNAGATGSIGNVAFFTGSKDISGSNALYWDEGNGRLGIGTASPAKELQISATTPTIRLVDSDNSSYGQITYTTTNLILQADPANTQASSTIQFEVDGNEHMRIRSDGNVGIGTTSPDTKLHISASTNVPVKISTNSGNNARISFAPDGGSELWSIGSNTDTIFNLYDVGTATSPFRVEVGAPSDSIRIVSSGNVGIGTTSPDGLLHISSGEGANGDARLIIESDTNDATETSNPEIWFKQDGDITEGFIGLDSNTLNIISNVSTAGGIQFWTGTSSNTGTTSPYNGATERMTITTAGDVGIGTTSPSASLGNDGVVLQIGDSGAGQAGLLTFGRNFAERAGMVWRRGTNTWDTAIFVDGSENLIIHTDYSAEPLGGADIVFKHGTSEIMRMVDTDVGIGTSSPSGALHVFTGTTGNDMEIVFREQGSNIQDIIFKEATGEYFSIRHDGSGASPNNNLIFRAASSTTGIDTDVMTIKQSGNVGIGTTSPGAKLHVHEAGSADGDLYVTNNTTATSASLFVGYWDEASTYQGLTVSRTYGSADITFDVNQSGALRFTQIGVERMRVHTDGNVGIGTTAPPEKLTVVGEVLISGSSGGELNLFNVASGQTWQVVSGFNGGFEIGNVNDGAIDSSAYFYIANSTGRVGIGTTSPGELLHLSASGDANIRLENNGNGNTSAIEFVRERSPAGGGPGKLGGAIWIESDTSTNNSDMYFDANTIANTPGDTTLNTNSARMVLRGGTPALSLYAGTAGPEVRLTTTGLGIGITSPGAKLHIVHQPGAAYASIIDFNDTTIDGTVAGLYIDHDMTGTTTPTANRSSIGMYVVGTNTSTGGTSTSGQRRYQYGTFNSLITTTGHAYIQRGTYNSVISEHSNTSNGQGEMSGVQNQVTGRPKSGATISNVYGTVNSVYADRYAASNGGNISNMYGSFNRLYTYSTYEGTGPANMYGVYSEVERNSTTGPTDNAIGIYSIIDNNAGTITNSYAFYGDIQNAATITNNWGIWINGESKNYFSGNVGIGTTDPQAILHTIGKVSHSITTSETVKINVTNDSGKADALTLSHNFDRDIGFKIINEASSQNFEIYVDGAANDDLKFRNTADNNMVIFEQGAGASTLVVDSNSRVGIGTASPSDKLDVRGSAVFSSSAFVSITVDQSDSGQAVFGVTSTTAETFINSVGNGAYAGAGEIKFLIETSEAVRIDNDGNVGIGTTDPGAKLDVVGDTFLTGSLDIWDGASGGTIQIYSDGSGQSRMIFGASGQILGVGGDFNIQGQNKDIQLSTDNGSNTLVHLDHADQRVGIGTTGPSELLHVAGGNIRVDRGSSTSGLSRNITISGARNGVGEPHGLLIFENYDSNTTTTYDAAQITSENATGAQDGDLRFWTHNGTSLVQRMMIDYDGNVGIGITDERPATSLEVVYSSGNGTITIDQNENAQGLYFTGRTGYDDYSIELANTNGLRFYNRTTSTAEMQLRDGKLGIGTTDPGGNFVSYRNDTTTDSTTITNIVAEQDGTGDASIDLLLTGTRRWRMAIDNSDGDKYKISPDASTSTNAVFTIDTSGNVGIGKTNPTQELHIGGGREILFNTGQGTIEISGSTGGWATGLWWIGSGGTSLGGFGGYGTADTMNYYWIGPAYNNANTFVVLDTGEVGIKDQSPSYDLDVNGTFRTTGAATLDDAFVFTSSSDGTGPYSRMQASGEVFPCIILDGIGDGDNWDSQGAQISLGESVSMRTGGTGLHLTYTGNGYGYIGMGTITSGIPAFSTLRFDYNSDWIQASTHMQFTDNYSASFGTRATGDLSIYHNGTNSYIDNKTGHLYIRNNVDDDDGSNIYIQAKSGENGIIVEDDGAVTLYYNNSSKLSTTSTGLNVTGNVTASGNIKLSGDGGRIVGGEANDYIYFDNATDEFRLVTDDVQVFAADNTAGLVIGAYDLVVDTDTLFVDASADRVGINDNTPSYSLDVNGTFRTTGNAILGDASGDTLTINAATINPANIAAGTDDTVVVYNGSTLVTDEINSKVWSTGLQLVDASGTPSNNQIATFTDSDTIQGESNLTYDGDSLINSAAGNIVTGNGDGSVAMTINDNQGNANITFNHANGVPDKSGNIARITVNVDATTGARMDFDVDDNAVVGSSVTSTTRMNLGENGLCIGNGTTEALASYILDATGTIRATVDVVVTSDIRLKNELPDTVQGLEAVDKMRPIKYTLKDDEDENPKTHLGFSAQELLDIVPEVVTEDDEGMYSVAYQKLVPVLVKAIQELTEEVRELKKKVGE